MNNKEAIVFADNMTYREAIINTFQSKGIKYKKSTRIKLNEMMKRLEWYESQDLIRREDIMPVVKRHHYLLSDRINSTDYGMFTGGIEQIILEQIPKAEPPKE